MRHKHRRPSFTLAFFSSCNLFLRAGQETSLLTQPAAPFYRGEKRGWQETHVYISQRR